MQVGLCHSMHVKAREECSGFPASTMGPADQALVIILPAPQTRSACQVCLPSAFPPCTHGTRILGGITLEHNHLGVKAYVSLNLLYHVKLFANNYTATTSI